jgi:MYXO-CTERM domain-containing protein
VKLEYFEGSNNLANQIEVLGPEVSATPEPATGGLAILAAGAMGVIALRRRRKNAA